MGIDEWSNEDLVLATLTSPKFCQAVNERLKNYPLPESTFPKTLPPEIVNDPQPWLDVFHAWGLHHGTHAAYAAVELFIKELHFKDLLKEVIHHRGRCKTLEAENSALRQRIVALQREIVAYRLGHDTEPYTDKDQLPDSPSIN